MIGLRRYSDFLQNKKKIRSHNVFFQKAKFNLIKQRLISLNQRSFRKSGVGKGFTDDSFHMQMSRGYCNVTPVKRDDSSRLHDKGPFYKTSKYARFLGHTRFHYWRGRSVIFPMAYQNIIAWYLDIIPQSVKDAYRSIDGIYCALPSYVNSFLTLSRFSKDNEGFIGKIDEKLLRVDRHLHRLKLPTEIPAACKEDVYYAKVTLGTHPGIATRKIAERVMSRTNSTIKRITKTHLLFWVTSDIINSWDKISNGLVGPTIGTYCVGSREKIQRVDVGDPVESRPLWIPEMFDVILGSTWLEVFKEYWQKYGLFDSEIWLGHSDTKMRYYRRIELDVKFKYSYEFDGQVWDSSVNTMLIVHAFNIFSSCFCNNKTVLNHFKFICDTFVMKRLILHNGNSFLITNGIPSGHAWTSHINSMCNWILWTSTIHNCPHIPLKFREDYELQIQGDDVCIHSNVFLGKNVRDKISEWMLRNFNYVASDDTTEPCKHKVKTSDHASSFLKRYTDVNGNLCTKTKDVWKKLIFGADYSGVRKSRMTYLYRRINDIAIIDPVERKRVSMFFAFTDTFERKFFNLPFTERLNRHHKIYEILFHYTDVFQSGTAVIWKKFSSLININLSEFNNKVKHFDDYIKMVYRQNYWTYDSKREYVDYWSERKQSVTVSKALRNVNEYQILSEISFLEKIHGPFLKKKK